MPFGIATKSPPKAYEMDLPLKTLQWWGVWHYQPWMETTQIPASKCFKHVSDVRLAGPPQAIQALHLESGKIQALHYWWFMMIHVSGCVWIIYLPFKTSFGRPILGGLLYSTTFSVLVAVHSVMSAVKCQEVCHSGVRVNWGQLQLTILCPNFLIVMSSQLSKYTWSHTTYLSRFCLVHTLIKNSNEYSYHGTMSAFPALGIQSQRFRQKKSDHTLNIYINCIKLYYCRLTSTQHSLKLASFSREKHRYFNDCPWLLTSFPSWDPWLEEPSGHSFTMPASATPTSCSIGWLPQQRRLQQQQPPPSQAQSQLMQA